MSKVIEFFKGLLVIWLGGIPHEQASEIESALRDRVAVLKGIGGSHK